MELKRAKEVLEGIGATIIDNKRIKGDDHVNMFFAVNASHARLNGDFTVIELEAIATWMRDPEGVVKA